MNMHLHHLTGCAPAPLAHYLKGLGILRLVSEQADKQARGWWQDEHFCLLTRLDQTELEQFFLERYAPTPFVSPWNKGSGFYQQNDPGIAPLEKSAADRFASFRAGIAAGRLQLAELSEADAIVRAIKSRTKAKKGMTPAEKAAAKALKDDPEYKRELSAAERRFKALKADLFTPCRLSWRGPHREWMDAALVFPEASNPIFPSLLGTGGNDGRLDFTNNAMQRLGELFDLDDPQGAPQQAAADLLKHALWLTPSNNLAMKAAVGQFLPGGAGGANSTTAAEGDSLVNPWDFILMLEGSILFSARATKRFDPNAMSQASAPFAVRSHTAGYGTPGSEKANRGEQWMPLWSKPSTLDDLRSLLGDARLQLGRQTAHRPLDVARAISRLGVARGIDAFTRFGYLERNGQSNLAVPLGRVEVRHRPRTRLIDDLAPWLDRLQRLARDKNAPARLVHAERRLADAVFAVLTHDDTPDRWQAVLLAAVAVEAIQAAGTAIKAGPIPRLSPEWVRAANDQQSAEFRLALSLGSAAGGYSREGRPFNPIRHHWLPLEPGAYRFQVSDKRLAHDPRVVMTGRNTLTDCAAVVQRRLIEAETKGRRRLPLVAAKGCEAHFSDLARLLGGGVDLSRVLGLARAFMALDWNNWSPGHAPRSPRAGAKPEEAWLALRLACLPWPLEDGRDIPAEPGIVRRLLAGDGSGAVSLALSRLHASGLRMPLQTATTDPHTAKLWAAALAFPINYASARRAASILDPNQKRTSQ